jgi:uncharacterized membrane protein
MEQRLSTMFCLGAARFTGGMSSTPVAFLVSAAAVSAATVGGLFYAFSTFVMRGLDRTGPAEAVIAMRGINAEAQANAPFLTLFFGSALVALAALTQLRLPGSGGIFAGAVLALVPPVVTVAFNIPLNNRLAATGSTAIAWPDYFRAWTLWNHVRTVAPLSGSVLMLIGVRLRLARWHEPVRRGCDGRGRRGRGEGRRRGWRI